MKYAEGIFSYRLNQLCNKLFVSVLVINRWLNIKLEMSPGSNIFYRKTVACNEIVSPEGISQTI